MKTPPNPQLQPEKAYEFRPYDADTEIAMKNFYVSLSEKDKRCYAGIEALKLGHGGQKYIAKVLGCSRGTVKKGACEVSDLPRKTWISAFDKGGSPEEVQREMVED